MTLAHRELNHPEHRNDETDDTRTPRGCDRCGHVGTTDDPLTFSRQGRIVAMLCSICKSRAPR